jgi:hypothetical protein
VYIYPNRFFKYIYNNDKKLKHKTRLYFSLSPLFEPNVFTISFNLFWQNINYELFAFRGISAEDGIFFPYFLEIKKKI